MSQGGLSRSKFGTHLRRLRLAKAIVIDQMNYEEALKYAGYPDRTAKRDGTKMVKAAHKEIQELMHVAGLTPERLLQKGSELLEAKQYSPVTVKGEDGKVRVETWTAPDPRVQERTLELATEMAGMRRWGAPGAMNSQNNVQVNVSFGGGAQGSAPASQKAMPVSVKVTNVPPTEDQPPAEIEPAPEEDVGTDPSGRPD